MLRGRLLMRARAKVRRRLARRTKPTSGRKLGSTTSRSAWTP